MTPKEIEDHVEFLRVFADSIGYLHGMAQEDILRVGDFVETLAASVYTHAVKHCRETSPEAQNVPVGIKSPQNAYTGMGGCSDCSQEGKSKKSVIYVRQGNHTIAITQADVAAMWRENEKSFEAGP